MDEIGDCRAILYDFDSPGFCPIYTTFQERGEQGEFREAGSRGGGAEKYFPENNPEERGFYCLTRSRLADRLPGSVCGPIGSDRTKTEEEKENPHRIQSRLLAIRWGFFRWEVAMLYRLGQFMVDELRKETERKNIGPEYRKALESAIVAMKALMCFW